MSTPPRPDKLPTLTEVVAHQDEAPAPAPFDETELVQRVLANVQRQVEAVLEQRMRDALTPALARIADSLLRETRSELASTLRDLVGKAVAQELSRHRDR